MNTSRTALDIMRDGEMYGGGQSQCGDVRAAAEKKNLKLTSQRTKERMRDKGKARREEEDGLSMSEGWKDMAHLLLVSGC